MAASVARAIFATVSLVAAAPAFAADPAPSMMAASNKSFKILAAEDFDPARLLPPPAADGSPAQQAELIALQTLVKTRSAERLAQAKFDSQHAEPMLFAASIGPSFDLQKLPATSALLALVQNEQSVANAAAKRLFNRNRPYVADPSLAVCDWKQGDPLTSSYPSGDATLGFSLGFVLASLLPEKAPAIQARAKDFALSREICGSHYPGDVEASHALAVHVATLLLANAKLQPQIDAARHELRAARLTN